VLRVDDDQGRCLGVEQLSTGTREQLLLALRLALVGSFARRGVSLPLVLDDVLVNFDVSRAKCAARVLYDFARRGHQVFVFTCHQHIARLFGNVKADVRHLPDHTRGNAVVDAPLPLRRPAKPAPPIEVPVAEPIEVPVARQAAEPRRPAADVPDIEIEPVREVQVEVVRVEPIVVKAAPVRPMPFELPPLEPVRVEAPPPPPKPRPEPPPMPRRRRRPALATQRWSAEEFAGELADRVRRDLVWDEVELESSSDSDDDSQAA
jgi:hypothetical protein